MMDPAINYVCAHIIELLKYVWQRENNVIFLVSIHLVSGCILCPNCTQQFYAALIRLKIIDGAAHAVSSLVTALQHHHQKKAKT